MGLHYLLGLCLAFLSFSTLAAPAVFADYDAANFRYSVNARTLKVPGVSFLSAAKDIYSNPLVKNENGGLSQLANGRLTVAVPETNKTLSVDIKGRFNVSLPGLKNSVKAFARTLPYLGTGLVAVEGIDYLISNHSDWFFDDDGYLVKPVEVVGTLPGVEYNTDYPSGFPADPGFSPAREYAVLWNGKNMYSGGAKDLYESAIVGSVYSQSDCRLFTNNNLWGHDNCVLLAKYEKGYFYNYVLVPTQLPGPEGDYYLTILSTYSDFQSAPSSTGSVLGKAWYGTAEPVVDYTHENVTLAEFDALVDSTYDPLEPDWRFLAPFFPSVGEPSTYTVAEPIGGYQPDSVITTTASAAGDVVTQADESFTLSVRANSTAQPAIDIAYNHVLDTYMDGLMVDTLSVASVYQASLPDADVTVYPDAVGGMGSPGLFDFCTFAPIVCDWFGWYQSDAGLPPENPDEDIFLGIDVNELDISGFETLDMSFGGGASCPEPMQIHITFLNRNIELTYDAWCSLADTARLLVLAVAWMSAVSIIIGGIRRS